MKILKLSIKNVMENKRRSFILGGFIFSVTFLLIFYDSFIVTIQGNMNNSIRYSLTGDVQIRPGETTEKDMFDISSTQNVLPCLSAEQIRAINNILEYKIKPESFVSTLRTYGRVCYGGKSENSRIVGLDLSNVNYQKNLVLVEGNYAKASNELVVNSEIAKKLEIKVGDYITLMGKDKNEKLRSIELKIVGIGNVQLLSSFGADPLYIDIKSVRSLTGNMKDEATDVLIFSDGEELSTIKEQLQEELINSGYTKDAFIITDSSEMGGFVNSIMLIYLACFYFFLVVFIIIIGVLILNIVSMSVTERRREIGTLRAIGFSKRQVITIFISEMISIALSSVGLGGGLGIMSISYLSQKEFAVVPPFDYIMGSYFKIQLNVGGIIPIAVAILFFTFITGLIPYYKGANERPVEILRG